MISLTKNIAVKYGKHNVRVNCDFPGNIHTPIWDERVATNTQIFDQLAEWYPLGRVGQPADIANAALFLASDEAKSITGALLPVDGGMSARVG